MGFKSVPRIKKTADNAILDTFGSNEPYYSSESQEKEMVALAVAAAKKQMLEGTASSQIITHYLKLGTVREQLELEKLRKENELLAAKKTAIKYMGIYSGHSQDDDEETDEYIDQDLY